MPRPWARVEQLAQGVVATEQRIDRQVVVGVVAVVGGRGEDRGEVQRGDPEVLEIVEPLDDPAQVATLEAVHRRWSVPRLERAGLVDALAGREPVGEDLVEDRVADPRRRVDAHRGRRRPVEARTTRWVGRILCSGVAASWRGPGLDGREEQLDRLTALARDRLVDGRERWIEVGGDLDVIEADDADIVGHAQPPTAERTDGPDRQRVAHGEDGGGTQAGPPRSIEGDDTAVDGGGTGDHALVTKFDAGRGERLAIPGQPASCDAASCHGQGTRLAPAARPR